MSAPIPVPVPYASAVLRARLIEAGLLREKPAPKPKTEPVLTQDFMGRKEAAREIFMSSDRIIKHVLGYRGTDPVVRARLGKLFASSRARETREKILKERRRWGR